MTHESEVSFEEWVVNWFLETCGFENVEQQVWQPGPRWYVDVVVDAGPVRYYIEIENDADSIRPGTGQALAYAADDVYGVPLVVIPKDHQDNERVRRMQRGSRVIIRAFDETATESGAWV